MVSFLFASLLLFPHCVSYVTMFNQHRYEGEGGCELVITLKSCGFCIVCVQAALNTFVAQVYEF